MKRRATKFGPIGLLLAMLSGGCTVDQYARGMIHQQTLNGRIRLALLGSGEQMLRQGRIDVHRRIVSTDGVEIDTWVIFDRRRQRAIRREAPTVPETRGTVVILHGLEDSKARFFGLGQRVANRGYDVVLPDHRAHGHSGGECVTYGAKERMDIRCVVDDLLDDGTIAEPIYVFGFSMGASTAVLYAAMDERVRGVVACAPYGSFPRMMRRTSWWMSEDRRREILRRAGELGGFDPDDTSPEKVAPELTIPLLVIHGTWDPIVPYREGRSVYEAAGGPKRMVRLPFIGHVSMLMGREKWFADQIDGVVRWARAIDPRMARSVKER